MFAFGGENVTRGNLKNLIVDKPSPITVALAQVKKSDSDGMFAFGGENVTRGNLKNLIVDKPSPITVALAQVKAKTLPDAVVAPAFVTGGPVAVSPLSNEDLKGVTGTGMAGTEEIRTEVLNGQNGIVSGNPV